MGHLRSLRARHLKGEAFLWTPDRRKSLHRQQQLPLPLRRQFTVHAQVMSLSLTWCAGHAHFYQASKSMGKVKSPIPASTPSYVGLKRIASLEPGPSCSDPSLRAKMELLEPGFKTDCIEIGGITTIPFAFTQRPTNNLSFHCANAGASLACVQQQAPLSHSSSHSLSDRRRSSSSSRKKSVSVLSHASVIHLSQDRSRCRRWHRLRGQRLTARPLPRLPVHPTTSLEHGAPL